MENLAETYYNQLKESNRKGLDLARFFSEIFDQALSKKSIITFSKLNKLYGWEKVYSAILDISMMEDINFDKVYGLLAYICKESLNKQEQKLNYPLLTTLEIYKKENTQYKNYDD